MGVRDIRDRVSDGGHAIADRLLVVWDRVRFASVRAKLVGVAAVAVIIGSVLATTLLVGGESATSRTDPLAEVIVGNTDLPATTWSGWTQTTLNDRPAVATPIKGTAKPADCIPGGQLQQRMQQIAVTGSQWAGREFTNVASAARATTMVARNDLNVQAAADAWVAGCAHATVTADGATAAVDVKSIGINPKTYRLEQAKLVAQSVTPQVANAQVSSTTLTAVGRSGDYALTVTLTIAGATTPDALTTLDTLWRAQAAKLVGYQQAGKLR